MALQTETASEVLAQLCLAFAAKRNKPMTMEDLILDPQPQQTKVNGKWSYTANGGLNMATIRSLQSVVKSHISFSNTSFQRDFVEFVARPLNPGAKMSSTNDWWVNAQGKNMKF